jgi:hypothetical protein
MNDEGLTKGEVLGLIREIQPDFPEGSFVHYRNLAGVQSVGERRKGWRIHKLYPSDAPKKIAAERAKFAL